MIIFQHERKVDTMKEIRNTFMRYELKYLVSDEQRARILELADKYIQPDEFGQSTICNIYYDTPDMRLVRRSLEKPVYKEKLRLRSYGRQTPEGKVFVELKKKYDDVVYKRRIAMPLNQAQAYLDGEAACSKENQITQELDYFLQSYPELAPAAYIAYDRQAFFGKDDPDFRVTFDSNILWRDTDLSLRAEAYGNALLKPGMNLMELKIAGAMPLWLAHELSAMGIYKVNFSKYGNAYKAMPSKITEGGRYCA